VCGRLKGLIPYGGLILPQSRESAEVQAQSYSSGAHRPCSAKAITSNQSFKKDWFIKKGFKDLKVKLLSIPVYLSLTIKLF
jgi:hypothetical protein